MSHRKAQVMSLNLLACLAYQVPALLLNRIYQSQVFVLVEAIGTQHIQNVVGQSSKFLSQEITNSKIPNTNHKNHYQFFPMHFKSYIIRFDEIENVEAITYSPIKDYGGWGIRYRMKGRAYNVKGNQGVKVYLKNGKNILFGSFQSQVNPA